MISRYCSRISNKNSLLFKHKNIRKSSIFQTWYSNNNDDYNNAIDKLNTTDSKITPYWLDQLRKIERPAAQSLISQLTNGNSLGFDKEYKKDSLLSLVNKEKDKHIDKVILVRVGDFYETYGIDAIMLVNYCGLNPMGGNCKAGCPIKNIQATLNDLTSNDLVVAVYEEASDVDITSGPRKVGKAKLKERYLSQIVSPAFSTYLYNLRLREDNIAFIDNKPAIGIRKTVDGYTMYQIYLDEQCIIISERLTEEGVRSMLGNSGFIEPIYIQLGNNDNNNKNSLSGSSLKFLYDENCDKIVINDNNFMNEITMQFLNRYEVNINHYRVINRNNNNDNQLRPIYTSTALQIGLLPNNNVPDLITNLLPKLYNSYSARFLRNWLLHPPPYSIATSMQLLIKELQSFPHAIPNFKPISIGKIFSLIRLQQCNVALFRDIISNINYLITMLQSSIGDKNSNNNNNIDYSSIVFPLLELTCYESGVSTDINILYKNSCKIEEKISNVIAKENNPDTYYKDANKSPIPEEFFKRNEEDFRGKIITSHSKITAIYSELEKTATVLCRTVREEFPEHCEIIYDQLNNKICFKKNKNSNSIVEYINMIDRKGKAVATKYTTNNVEKALANYLNVAAKAPVVVSNILAELCADLEDSMFAILHLAHWSVILHSVIQHTAHAMQQKWCLPQLTNSNSGRVMKLQGLSPYWMKRDLCRLNSIDLTGIFLLTAPNMSGKSTLMRSVIVTALLANCGLFVPCTDATVPLYDNLFLRTASYDIPSEGKSAFALEMDDVRVVLRDCTDRSLVMIDELGKGTSARDGSALAGALIEELDNRKVTGIFATHLHELFDLPLVLNQTTNKKMGFNVNDNNEIEWTYLLEDGSCTDSMALHTARLYNIDHNIIARAKELSSIFDTVCRGFSNDNDNSSNNSSNSSVDSGQLQYVYDLEKGILPLLRGSINAFNDNNISTNDLEWSIIARDYEPPLLFEAKSCVYILLLRDSRIDDTNNSNNVDIGSNLLPDCLYIGETASIRQRLHQHRTSTINTINNNNALSGRKYQVSAAAVSIVDNKSEARRTEAAIITILINNKYNVISCSDANHVLF